VFVGVLIFDAANDSFVDRCPDPEGGDGDLVFDDRGSESAVESLVLASILLNVFLCY
jgi:hypothetical protein